MVFKKWTCAAVLAALLFSAGCAQIGLQRDYAETARLFREDVLNFYDTVSDAYFILGYEYYELAREFEKKGVAEQATYYHDKATIYYNLSKDLKNAAVETRKLSTAE